MKSGVYSFLEAFDEKMVLPEGNIVSLEPQVSYELGKRNISYQILEDFVSPQVYYRAPDNFFSDQWQWFEKFDSFLQKHYPMAQKYQLRCAQAHYNRLKYLIDSVILRARTVRFFLQNQKISKVIFVTREDSLVPSIYAFYHRDRRSLKKFFQLAHAQGLCADSFEWEVFKAHGHDSVSFRAGQGRYSVKESLRWFLSRLNLKSITRFFLLKR